MTVSLGPYAFTLTAAESETVVARFGFRRALSGKLTANHFAPLAAFVLTMLFATILALTGFISRRAGEAAILLAASAYMIQRLVIHWRLRRAPAGAKDALLAAGDPESVRFDEDGVTHRSGTRLHRLAYADVAMIEHCGGLIYLWPKAGAPVALPTRILADGEAQRILAAVRDRTGSQGPENLKYEARAARPSEAANP